jgi:D-xylose 1-dehydrogenase (NADP+, D-xylono-1,5-lactone-forming)
MSVKLPVLRWGILGTGHIANRFAGQVAGLGGRARLRMVGAREPARAREFALLHGVERAGSYLDVLADPQVDAVYISLLNRDHAHWSIAAAHAGKHVLCEKPAAMNAAELESMLAAARTAKVRFIEAFAYRFHPRWTILRSMLSELGGPVSAVANFCFHAGDPPKPRLVDPVGGGALMDVGCYPLSWLLALLGRPETVRCVARRAPSGVDLSATVSLSFAGGHLAQALCACDAALPQMAHIAGPVGMIEISEPYRSKTDAVFRLHTAHGVRDIPWQDDGLELYAREALALAACHEDGQHPDMTWDDSLSLAQTIDDCRAQAGVRWPGEA